MPGRCVVVRFFHPAAHFQRRDTALCFIFEAHPELNMRNTTNLLDGRFADLKRKLGCHHGMKRENKARFIKDYFSDNGGD